MTYKNDLLNLGTSVNIPQGQIQREKPNVDIIPPNVLGSPTQLRWTVGFVWTHPVTEFTDSDIKVSGDISGTPIEMFAGDGFDYTANLILKYNSEGSVTLTIEKDTVVGNGTTGPPQDVSVTIEFDTRPKEQPQQNILCVRKRSDYFNNDLNLTSPGGVYRNILSSAKLDNYIYFVAQIERHGGTFARDASLSGASTFFDDGASLYIQAGAVLYRLNTTNCAFEIIKRYKNVTTAARSLVPYNGRMYGVEGSHYAYLNDGLVRDFGNNIDNYQRSRFRDVEYDWKKISGNLFSIANDENEITQHGIVKSANPSDNPNYNESHPDAFYGIHTGTASPLSVETDEITGVLGYGDYSKVVDETGESETARYKNIAWISLGTRLNRRIPILKTNDRSAFEIISEIARITNSIMYFDADTFVLKPRDNEDDPDHKIELNPVTLEQPIEEINVSNDIGNLYKVISITYDDNQVFRKEDEESIKSTKKRKEYSMTVPLDISNIEWIEWIAEQFLKRFSKPRNTALIQLKPSPHLKLGDKVEINAKERVHLSGNWQVIETNHIIFEHRSEVRFVSL